jgi:hypothetical protein
MEKKWLSTIIVLAVVIGFVAGGFSGGIVSFILLHNARTRFPFAYQPPASTPNFAFPFAHATPRPLFQPPNFSRPAFHPPNMRYHTNSFGLPGSIQASLIMENKTGIRTNGNIVVGSYVMDIYEGRENQPTGRGSIGKVVSLGPDENGVPGATVDFGRGYSIGIHLSELSLVQVRPTQDVLSAWQSSWPPDLDSLQGTLRSEKKKWTRSNETISVGSYVEDTLEGRLDQPRQRGAIAKVQSLSPDGKCASVDFGNGYATSINISELSPVQITP